jgi:hypothetical protein
VVVLIPYAHHPHLPLDHYSPLELDIGVHLYLYVHFDQVLVRVEWCRLGMDFTWILWSYFFNHHPLQSTRSCFIIYNIKIILLHLRAISLIKHRVICGFNTTASLMLDTFFIKIVFYLSVLELSAIITSNPLDFSIELILCSLQEFL